MASAYKVVLNESAVVAASANTTAKSLTSRLDSFVGFFKLSGRTAGDYTVKIQHSPNGSDWFDVVSFTAPPSADGQNFSELKQITTNILGQVRANLVVANGPGDGTVLVELWYDEKK